MSDDLLSDGAGFLQSNGYGVSKNLTTETRKLLLRYTPLGVAVRIGPWNYPIPLACGTIAPLRRSHRRVSSSSVGLRRASFLNASYSAFLEMIL
jgi:hypothetical protein